VSLFSKLLVWVLRQKRFSTQDKAYILTALLSNIQALPIKDIISYDLQGTILVNGKPLTLEQAIALKESAVALADNSAYKLIKDQVAWEAIKMGIHRSVSTDQLILAKASLWVAQEEAKLINSLSGEV
jgi:hypothetical protein